MENPERTPMEGRFVCSAKAGMVHATMKVQTIVMNGTLTTRLCINFPDSHPFSQRDSGEKKLGAHGARVNIRMKGPPHAAASLSIRQDGTRSEFSASGKALHA